MVDCFWFSLLLGSNQPLFVFRFLFFISFQIFSLHLNSIWLNPGHSQDSTITFIGLILYLWQRLPGSKPLILTLYIKFMGVTSLGRHTRPGCNLGFYAVRSINQDSDLVLHILCVFFLFDFRGMRGDWGFVFWVSYSYPGSTRSFKTMRSMRMGGVTWFLCPNMGIDTSSWSHGLNTRCWLVETISASLWLVGTYSSLVYY